MIQLLTILLFNCLYIFGFRNAVEYSLNVDKEPDVKDRELLWWFSWYLRGLPEIVKTPLFGCVVCMASVHSWMYWIFYDFNLYNGFMYIIYIFALSGLNYIVNARLSS